MRTSDMVLRWKICALKCMGPSVCRDRFLEMLYCHQVPTYLPWLWQLKTNWERNFHFDNWLVPFLLAILYCFYLYQISRNASFGIYFICLLVSCFIICPAWYPLYYSGLELNDRLLLVADMSSQFRPFLGHVYPELIHKQKGVIMVYK